MSEQEKKADLDWLYRRDPSPEPTAVMPTMPTAGQGFGPPPGPPVVQQGGYAPPPGNPLPQPVYAAPPTAPVRPAKRKHPLRRTLIALVVAWLAFMLGTPIYAWTRVSTVDVTPSGSATRPPDTPGTLTLLVGSDSREGLTEQQKGELGTGTTAGKRTDTMMLLYSPPTGQPALISLPRDSYLPIPGHGKDKLNAAYALGGPNLLVATVEANTGLRVDGYLEVGFLAIVDSVNALGGVEVCLKAPIKDKDSHLDLPTGCQTLDGKNALNYVRMRKADPTGDLGRMQRQRQMIATITKDAASPLNVLNPVTYWRLNMAAGGSLVRGSNTGVGEVVDAAMSFRAISSSKGYTLTVPIANANATTAAGSSMLWDTQRAQAMFSIIASGTTDGLAQFVK